MTLRERLLLIQYRLRLWWTRPTKAQLVRECTAVAVKHLRDEEWSMGNGQCYACGGVPPGWLGHPLHLTPETIGHRLNCEHAAALVALGEKVIYLGSFKSSARYRICTSPDGYMDTELIPEEEVRHG